MTATNATVTGQSRAEEGQGAVGSAICAAHVPAVEMACGVDPGTSVLEGSNFQKNWVMDFDRVVGGGGSNKAWEPIDLLGAITSGWGGSGSITTAPGAGSDGNHPSPHPCPSLHHGHHW